MSINNKRSLNEGSALMGRESPAHVTAKDAANAKVLDAMKADLQRASKSGFGDFNPMARYARERAARGDQREVTVQRAFQTPKNDAESYDQTRLEQRLIHPFYSDRGQKRSRLEEPTAQANNVTKRGTFESPTGPLREQTVQPLSSAPPPTPQSLSEDDSASSSQEYLNLYPVKTGLPTWYSAINPHSREMKDLRKRTPPELTTLDNLKVAIRACVDQKLLAPRATREYDLREAIHRAEVLPNVHNFSLLLKKVRILEAEQNGLPLIFEANSTLPPEIKADAYQLYYRWWHGILDQDLLRGIKTIKGKDRNGDRLDKQYRDKFSASANFYGEGHLVPGQWWPTQLSALRDGAHGSSQGGIAGDNDKGAYSIVLSSGGYHDKDNGDEIDYSGTDGKDGNITSNTAQMIKSYELQTPIRVLRSSQLPKGNKYRPKYGFRYDGLYKVTGYTVKDLSKQAHVFEMKRLSNQTPIRNQGATVRPTKYEVLEFEKLRKKW